MDIKEHFQVWFIQSLIKKNRIRGEKNVNKVLAQESYKPVVENLKKNLYARDKDNISAAYLR